MDDVAIPEIQTHFKEKSQVRANDIPHILDHYPHIQTLSLDCFDTLLWRLTAAPKDIFYHLQNQACYQRLNVTAYQRINAAALAYRMKFATHGIREITLHDIYKNFTSLSATDHEALIQAELDAEAELTYAFMPFVELIRQAKSRDIKIVIVSDTYLTKSQLHQLLSKKMPADVMNAITLIFCSSEYGKSKSNGLFSDVLNTLSLPPHSILHIGDHAQADYTAPSHSGIHALHFLQFDIKTTDLLRAQHNVAALSGLTEPTLSGQLHSPRYSPFRGLFALTKFNIDSDQTLIGYHSFGPILYAFAQFVSQEIATLEQQGKRTKVFFLLRDAHLLSLACETYAGKSLGKSVRIRKFVTVAASFKTRADVDAYLASLTPQYYNFYVICEQLLLPTSLRDQLIQLANTSDNAEKTFNELIHREDVLDVVFKQSSAYRERLNRYIKKEMQLSSGDTVVLVDMGYIGTTQKHLTKVLQDQLNVEIVGLYLTASHEADRPMCKSLITTTACDHGLLEQSSTYKEGAVLDYDNEGNPIFDKIRLSEAQYDKVNALQQECLRFITDAKSFLSTSNLTLPYSIIQANAFAALRRHVYFPLESEVAYFQTFQHDKDMGPNLNKTMYNISNGLQALRHSHTAFHLHPYEIRMANLEIAYSTLLQKTFQLDLLADEMSFNQKQVKVVIVKNNSPTEITLKAKPTHDGYFSLLVPAMSNAQIGILFGCHFHWLQIENIQIHGIAENDAQEMGKHFVFNHMEGRSSNLFECTSNNALLLITPTPTRHIQGYQIVFRPVIERTLI